MSLNADIQILIEGVRSKVPPQVFVTLGAMFARLEADAVAKQVPKPGEQVPPIDLVSADGNRITLSALYGKQPLVLLFYRGRWCPFCDLTLRAFENFASQFDAAGITLAAISPQTLMETAATSDERNLSFELYSDPGNAAARAFGLDWQVQEGAERSLYQGFGSEVDKSNGDDEWRLPAPAAFVIDQSGLVRWSWADSNWTHRPEPQDVLRQALTNID